MSIKTKHASRIFLGTKTFEYRRKSIGEKNCNKKIYIYSSETEKAIIGYIVVDKIIKGNLEYVLNKTNNQCNQNTIDYFKKCDICYALHIKEKHKFLKPISLVEIKQKYKDFTIPQFYRYLKKNESIYKDLEKRLYEN